MEPRHVVPSPRRIETPGFIESVAVLALLGTIGTAHDLRAPFVIRLDE